MRRAAVWWCGRNVAGAGERQNGSRAADKFAKCVVDVAGFLRNSNALVRGEESITGFHSWGDDNGEGERLTKKKRASRLGAAVIFGGTRNSPSASNDKTSTAAIWTSVTKSRPASRLPGIKLEFGWQLAPVGCYPPSPPPPPFAAPQTSRAAPPRYSGTSVTLTSLVTGLTRCMFKVEDYQHRGRALYQLNDAPPSHDAGSIMRRPAQQTESDFICPSRPFGPPVSAPPHIIYYTRLRSVPSN